MIELQHANQTNQALLTVGPINIGRCTRTLYVVHYCDEWLIYDG